MYFNGDIGTSMSQEQTVLIKGSDGIWKYQVSNNIKIGDTLLKYNFEQDGFDEIEVLEITRNKEEIVNVYKIDTEDVDTFIAGNIVVHNIKAI
jgi:intein/homing endonuclease